MYQKDIYRSYTTTSIPVLFECCFCIFSQKFFTKHPRVVLEFVSSPQENIFKVHYTSVVSAKNKRGKLCSAIHHTVLRHTIHSSYSTV